jgi:hypothetical protein
LQVVQPRKKEQNGGRMRISLLLSIAIILACVAVEASAQTEPSSPTATKTSATNDDTGVHFDLNPYLWFAGAHGIVGAAGHDVGFHASPGDLLSHLDIGLLGAAELRYDRLVVNGDLMWIRLSDSRALPFPALSATSADVRVGELVWTSKIGYRGVDRKRIKIDGNAGVRFWHLGQNLKFNPSRLGLNFNGSQNWADIVVGGRVQLPMGEKAVVELLGDVGGLNAMAKQDYQFAALLGFKIRPKWTLAAGYRYLFVDYRLGALPTYNMVTSGALLGISYHFR